VGLGCVWGVVGHYQNERGAGLGLLTMFCLVACVSVSALWLLWFSSMSFRNVISIAVLIPMCRDPHVQSKARKEREAKGDHGHDEHHH
jgi:hypothetical protein